MPEKKAVAAKKKVSKGDLYECGVCGMSVIVDEPCGCEDTCDIMCCGQPMKERSSPNDVREKGPVANEADLAVKFVNFLV